MNGDVFEEKLKLFHVDLFNSPSKLIGFLYKQYENLMSFSWHYLISHKYGK